MIDTSKSRVKSWLVRYLALPAIVLGISMMTGAGVGAIVKPGLKQIRQGDMSGRMLAVEALPAAENVSHSPSAHASTALLTTAMEPTQATAAMTPIAPQPTVSEPVEQPQPRTQTRSQKQSDNLVEYRYFNGRRIRPARTMTMITTAYSPDERSCGPEARGITASGKTVWTNGMKMVAADTRILPFGTLVSIPGYYDGQPVPVLDRGGAIKGNRLDLLYPSHERALQWGRKRQVVTIWEYVD